MNLSPEAVVLRPGMALTLTLNGIAQGYIAVLLASHGLTRARIDTGEMFVLPETPWPVQLADREIALQNRALATSVPLGMTFGGDGQTSHIRDRPPWLALMSLGLRLGPNSDACRCAVNHRLPDGSQG